MGASRFLYVQGNKQNEKGLVPSVQNICISFDLSGDGFNQAVRAKLELRIRFSEQGRGPRQVCYREQRWISFWAIEDFHFLTDEKVPRVQNMASSPRVASECSASCSVDSLAY